MPFAVTHVLTSIILVDLYRDYVTKHKKYFTLHTIFIAGFAGLLPDIDIPLGMFLNLFGVELAHRTVTHTPFFGLLFLIPGIIYWRMKKHKIAVYFFVTTFAILLHISFDYIFATDHSAGVALFYPFSYETFHIGILGTMGILKSIQLFAAIDAVILLTWLWHEEVKHKISDFI